MPEQITNTAGTFLTGLNSGFSRLMYFIPSLFGGIVILVAGWFISKFVGRLLERVLMNVKIETAVEKAHINDYLPTTESGTKVRLSSFAGGIVKWFLFLIFVQAAAISMGIVQLSVIINSIILFIPNIFAAVAIMVAGAWASHYISGIVESSTSKMGFGTPNMPVLLVRYGILGFAAIASVSQLGIATNLINILFTGFVASLAIAFGLAFGLGGRDAASIITRNWLSKSRSLSEEYNRSMTGGKISSEDQMTH